MCATDLPRNDPGGWPQLVRVGVGVLDIRSNLSLPQCPLEHNPGYHYYTTCHTPTSSAPHVWRGLLRGGVGLDLLKQIDLGRN